MLNNVDQQGRFIDSPNPTCRVVSVCCLQAGQAKPYGDSWYRYRVTLSMGDATQSVMWRTSREQVLKLLAPVFHERLYERGEAPHAFAPVIETVEETEPGVWLVEARAPYND